MMRKERIEVLIEKIAVCQAMCNLCLANCFGREDAWKMADCIRLERECAVMCSTALSFVASDTPFSREMLGLCAEICRICAEECLKYADDSCNLCAEACHECADVCSVYAY